MATTVEERLRALERVILREEARLRRARAQVAVLRRAYRRLPGDSPGGTEPAIAQALTRRRAPTGPSGEPPVCFLQAGSLALDRETNVAFMAAGSGERRAALTPSEAGLLALLMERPARVWSCRDLARLALGYDVVETEAVAIVRPHISRLRQKLEPDPLQPHLIRTVRGQGYLLSP